ncbi:MAG TPA: ester cyclase [Planctomycetota bacterium]|nr:ester cyclase [Planctomycetota bacterium]
MAKKYKTLLHEWMDEVWNKNDLSAVDRMMKPGCVIHGLLDEEGKTIIGRAAFKKLATGFRRIFPDIRFDIADSIAEKNKIAARCTVSGTHLGEGFGLPATGKKVVFDGTVIVHARKGVIAEAWNNFDYMALCAQLGQGISSIKAVPPRGDKEKRLQK